MVEKEDLRLVMGGLGHEEYLDSFAQSPTWVINEAWDMVQDVGRKSLDAYMHYCKLMDYPHSYVLGLDILLTGVVGKDDNVLTDLRPTLLEGPCCNSYPASPDLYPYLLYRQAKEEAGWNVDDVEYPVHPLEIGDAIAKNMVNIWKARGHEELPVLAAFTRPYPESEEEQAHVRTLEAFKRIGCKAFRITPDEKPYVKDGKLWVDDTAIDVVYRRIERIHVPVFYGEELADRIINHTPETIYVNDWKIDDWRSKTIEERAFRKYEEDTGVYVPRPVTLLDDERTPERVRELADQGGFALKLWNSTGGKGIFLHLNMARAKKALDFLYKRYDGRHMILMDEATLEEKLKMFESYEEDAAIQQLRLIDGRRYDENVQICYDTRINVMYDEVKQQWDFLSGASRIVPCGPTVNDEFANGGNSMLTNVSSGAFMAPLIMGYTKEGADKDRMVLGPIQEAILAGKNDLKIE